VSVTVLDHYLKLVHVCVYVCVQVSAWVYGYVTGDFGNTLYGWFIGAAIATVVSE
jgi:uncharacterized membrane protein YccC